MFNLGVIHWANGDEDLARQWWGAAAADGHLLAIQNLGRLLRGADDA